MIEKYAFTQYALLIYLFIFIYLIYDLIIKIYLSHAGIPEDLQSAAASRHRGHNHNRR